MFLCAAIAVPCARAAEAFQFGDTERIVFVGNDFFEHEAEQCYIETALTARFPDKNLVFRNLGYSGDTVSADARNLCAGWENFGPPEQGFNRLKDLIGQIHPTIIFVAYGMNESFAGEKGLADFQSGFDKMLDMLGATKARMILVSPIAHEKLPTPLPDPAEHNRKLELYVKAIESTAAKRNCTFIDLFHHFSPATSDGIHLTAEGYKKAAVAMEKSLGYEPQTWHLSISAAGQVEHSTGTQIDTIKPSSAGLSFVAHDTAIATTPPILQVSVLPPGQYELSTDSNVIAEEPAENWGRGVILSDAGPSQEEALRQQIIRKNFYFFSDWRAENDTYILGYRKHEQGRNAPEMAEFEKLAQQADADIAKLRVPSPVHYDLVKQ